MLSDIDLAYDSSGRLHTGRTLVVDGDLAVGGAVTAASVGGTQPNIPVPTDHGLISWSYDPVFTSSAFAAVAGTLYLSVCYVRQVATVSKLWWINGAAGTTVTAGQNFAALIGPTGSLLASAGIDAKNGSGPQSIAITSQTLGAGFYWVGILWNGSALPSFARHATSLGSSFVLNQSGGAYRFCVNGTGLTALPASITPGSNTTAGATPFWSGIST